MMFLTVFEIPELQHERLEEKTHVKTGTTSSCSPFDFCHIIRICKLTSFPTRCTLVPLSQSNRSEQKSEIQLFLQLSRQATLHVHRICVRFIRPRLYFSFLTPSVFAFCLFFPFFVRPLRDELVFMLHITHHVTTTQDVDLDIIVRHYTCKWAIFSFLTFLFHVQNTCPFISFSQDLRLISSHT